MKTVLINFSQHYLVRNIKTPFFLLVLTFIFAIAAIPNADAQRRGGERAPSWHYTNVPARGAFFKGYPRGATSIYFGKRSYYYHGGIFYHPFRGGYIIAPPPFGLRVAFLPRGFFAFYVGGLPYYYYCGTYYIPRNGQYEVAPPPVGAVIESLPQGFQKVELDGQTYYTCDDTQYKPVMKDGEVWYEVIKSPNKATEPESYGKLQP